MGRLAWRIAVAASGVMALALGCASPRSFPSKSDASPERDAGATDAQIAVDTALGSSEVPGEDGFTPGPPAGADAGPAGVDQGPVVTPDPDGGAGDANLPRTEQFTLPAAPMWRLVTGMTVGPDGDIWYVESINDRVGKVSGAGAFTEFEFPAGAAVDPFTIATGSDGKLWVTDRTGGIWRFSSTGSAFERFPIPSNLTPRSIVATPNGALWFTLNSSVIARRDAIGRISTTGVVDEFLLAAGEFADSGGLTLGADGNVWFETEQKVGRITPAGEIAYFAVPSRDPRIEAMTLGPDGNVWFVEWRALNVGRISPSGVIKEFPVPTAQFAPRAITAGQDGNLWFGAGPGLARVTPSGEIREFRIATGVSNLVRGRDGKLWYSGTTLPTGGAAVIGVVRP